MANFEKDLAVGEMKECLDVICIEWNISQECPSEAILDFITTLEVISMQDIISCEKWTSTQLLPFLEVSGHILYGKEFFRCLLNLCTCVSIALMYWLFKKKADFIKKKLFLLVFIIGALNGFAHFALASNLIGSFYERNNYSSEKYDSYIYNSDFQNDKYVFCIATISHHKGISVTWRKGPYFFIYDNYFLEKIELPYGRVRDNLFTFYPDGKYGIAIEHIYPSFVLEIDGVATSESYDYLKSQVPSVDGDIIASLNGDVYHFPGCIHINKIKANNIIHFNSPTEAEFYGYRICSDCI